MAPCWKVREIDLQTWWAVDLNSGIAFKLYANDGERLWRMPASIQALPLHEARSAGEMTGEAFIDLEFLGLCMRYWCSAAWVAEIARQYASLVPALRRSPDVEVRLGVHADFGRLHRSAEGNIREGVQVRAAGVSDWSPGDPSLPIIPVLQAGDFAGRFCALHGALIAGHQGGIVVCGNQKAGKTTAALTAERVGFGKLLADETTLIDRDATAHGVPLPVRERSLDGRVVRALARASPNERCRGMALTDIVVLEASEGPAMRHLMCDDSTALKLLTPHLRVLDTSLGEAADRLLALIATCKIWRWQVSLWPQLQHDVAAGLEDLASGRR
jgi:hypothetical protein